jgi:AcrR family transcriptional regulator
MLDMIIHQSSGRRRLSRHSPAPREATRQAILDSAAALFQRIGYGKTTIADIADTLAMSSANVYRFFPSKSAINDAICRRMLAALREQLHALAVGRDPPADRLAALILFMHRWHRDQLTDNRRVHDMVDAAMAENWQAIAEHRAACEAIFAALIREGQAARVFAPGDAVVLGQTAMGACCGLFHPTLIAQQSAAQPDDGPARRIAWLVVQALGNRRGSKLP